MKTRPKRDNWLTSRGGERRENTARRCFMCRPPYVSEIKPVVRASDPVSDATQKKQKNCKTETPKMKTNSLRGVLNYLYFTAAQISNDKIVETYEVANNTVLYSTANVKDEFVAFRRKCNSGSVLCKIPKG